MKTKKQKQQTCKARSGYYFSSFLQFFLQSFIVFLPTFLVTNFYGIFTKNSTLLAQKQYYYFCLHLCFIHLHTYLHYLLTITSVTGIKRFAIDTTGYCGTSNPTVGAGHRPAGAWAALCLLCGEMKSTGSLGHWLDVKRVIFVVHEPHVIVNI